MGEDAVVRGCNGSNLFWPVGDCRITAGKRPIAARLLCGEAHDGRINNLPVGHRPKAEMSMISGEPTSLSVPHSH